jgi:hypothetical protein
MLDVRYGYWAIGDNVVEKYSIKFNNDTYSEKDMCLLLYIPTEIFREIMLQFNGTPRGDCRYYTFETQEDTENAIVALKLIGVG